MSRKRTKDLNRHFFKEHMQMAKNCMKTCSTLLFMRENQIMITARYHSTNVRMSIKEKGRCSGGFGVIRALCALERNVKAHIPWRKDDAALWLLVIFLLQRIEGNTFTSTALSLKSYSYYLTYGHKQKIKCAIVKQRKLSY